MIDAMHGALVVCCLFAALFFVRFWIQTRDRFFGWFGASMVLFALNWVGVLWVDITAEARHGIYGVRLAAFLLLIAAIVDKNRRA
jgi:hypothetical protein